MTQTIFQTEIHRHRQPILQFTCKVKKKIRHFQLFLLKLQYLLKNFLACFGQTSKKMTRFLIFPFLEALGVGSPLIDKGEDTE